MPQNEEYDAFVDEDFDASEDFKNEEEVNAPEYAAEGFYHLGVQQVDASGKNSPGAVFLTFEILEGNVENQIGKQVRYPIWPPHPSAKDQAQAKKVWKKTVLRLMLALGLRKVGEFPKFKMTQAWWDSIEGKQCIARVTHQKQKQTTETGKDIEWVKAVIARRDDLFSFDDKAVADVPTNKKIMALGGYLDDSEGI